jgi:hypothetical protein
MNDIEKLKTKVDQLRFSLKIVYNSNYGLPSKYMNCNVGKVESEYNNAKKLLDRTIKINKVLANKN